MPRIVAASEPARCNVMAMAIFAISPCWISITTSAENVENVGEAAAEARDDEQAPFPRAISGPGGEEAMAKPTMPAADDVRGEGARPGIAGK